MQFDSQERPRIFYIILFGVLILAIVFFVNRVKLAINSSKNKDVEEAQASTSQTIEDSIVTTNEVSLNSVDYNVTSNMIYNTINNSVYTTNTSYNMTSNTMYNSVSTIY